MYITVTGIDKKVLIEIREIVQEGRKTVEIHS